MGQLFDRILKVCRFLIVLFITVGTTSCLAPIWNKLQKRAVQDPLFKGNLESIVPVQVADGQFADWQSFWVTEAEQPPRISFLPKDSCLDIVAPKGLTLWYKQPFEGDVTFRYEVCAVAAGDSLDRCSDLNCFWMATDPQRPDNIFARADFRGGVFAKTYSMSLYYMGFGGNSNTTTRFRKYDGNYENFSVFRKRPPILKEYTDSAHLIKPNHWYSVEIIARKGVVEYWLDDRQLVNLKDVNPLTRGWFGFRTTQNHLRIRNFSVMKP
jgi:hypothetical protein